jgi:histone H2A
MNNKNSSKSGPKCIVHQLENVIQRMDDPDELGVVKFDNSAVVFSTAALTYLVDEILKIATQEAKNEQSNIINPRHLQLAIRGDKELDTLLKQCIYGAGFFLGHRKNTVQIL